MIGHEVLSSFELPMTGALVVHLICICILYISMSMWMQPYSNSSDWRAAMPLFKPVFRNLQGLMITGPTAGLSLRQVVDRVHETPHVWVVRRVGPVRRGRKSYAVSSPAWYDSSNMPISDSVRSAHHPGTLWGVHRDRTKEAGRNVKYPVDKSSEVVNADSTVLAVSRANQIV